MEDQEKKETTKKNKFWSPRVYFIMTVVSDNGLTSQPETEIWRDNLSSEKECLEMIRSNGEYDTKYIIGYRSFNIKPIIKQARIVLR